MAKDIGKKPKATPGLMTKGKNIIKNLSSAKIGGIPVGKILNAALYFNMAKDIGTGLTSNEE